MIKRVSPQKAKELVKEGAILVDVRQGMEYNSGHIQNAVNIPLDRIAGITKKAEKDQNVVLYCQSGARSGAALTQLKSMGYKNVYDLGAIHRW